MTTSPPPQPAVMRLIRERRKRLDLSYDRAGKLAGITGTRWRQLENGYRVIRGTPMEEPAPARTLARMALAVGVLPDDLTEHGETEAAGRLTALRESAAETDGEIRAQAERAAAAITGLTERQHQALTDKITDDLRSLRDEG